MEYTIKNRKTFKPTPGEIYENAGGSWYRCEALCPDDSAWFTNVKSGWHFNAKGIGIYQDGRIDWDYSILGRFTQEPDDAIDAEAMRALDRHEAEFGADGEQARRRGCGAW